MFRKLQPLLIASRLLQQTRSYAPRSYNQNEQFKTTNPGVRKRMNLLQDFEEYLDDPEGFGNYESDFADVHKVHKEYERELKYDKEKIQQIMVKNKYFKSTGRNFLTWAEKEQIRFLHKQEPSEWTIEKLSESFPALPETIAKVVKNEWVPKNSKRFQKHDEQVKESWKLYQTNKLADLDPEFVEHLKKFSNRKFSTENNANTALESVNKFKFPPSKNNEFSNIITSCKGYKMSQPAIGESSHNNKLTLSEKNGEMVQQRPTDEMFIMGKVSNKKHMKFDQLEQVKSTKRTVLPVNDEAVSMNPFNNINNTKNITIPMNNPNGTGVISFATDDSQAEFITDKIEKYQTRNVKLSDRKPSTDLMVDNSIREYIKIPKRLFKKGATYQKEDCFYDDDGEFLYRVPGMATASSN